MVKFTTNPNDDGDKKSFVQTLTLEHGIHDSEAIFCFADPSTFADNPGWPLRNLLALIAHSCPHRLFKAGQQIRIICLRQKAKDLGMNSLVLNLEFKAASPGGIDKMKGTSCTYVRMKRLA